MSKVFYQSPSDAQTLSQNISTGNRTSSLITMADGRAIDVSNYLDTDRIFVHRVKVVKKLPENPFSRFGVYGRFAQEVNLPELPIISNNAENYEAFLVDYANEWALLVSTNSKLRAPIVVEDIPAYVEAWNYLNNKYRE